MVKNDGVTKWYNCCLDSGCSFRNKMMFFLENFDRLFQFSYKENIEVVNVKYFAALDSKSSVLLSCRPGPEEKLQGGLTLNILYSL